MGNFTTHKSISTSATRLPLIANAAPIFDGGVVKEFNPEVVEKVDMDDEVINAVKQGMKRVVDEGSASEIFANYGIAVGGKQVRHRSETVQITLCLLLLHRLTIRKSRYRLCLNTVFVVQMPRR